VSAHEATVNGQQQQQEQEQQKQVFAGSVNSMAMVPAAAAKLMIGCQQLARRQPALMLAVALQKQLPVAAALHTSAHVACQR
jgi:hypothetical protein